MNRGDHVKLIGEPEQPQQPTFPHTNVQFGPQGFAVQIFLADDIILTKVFDKQAAETIRQHLNEIAKQDQAQLATIQNIMKSKLH